MPHAPLQLAPAADVIAAVAARVSHHANHAAPLPRVVAALRPQILLDGTPRVRDLRGSGWGRGGAALNCVCA